MKLQVNHEAVNDIAEIKRYIREEYGNPAAANRIAGKIVKTYKLLKTMPYIGSPLNAVSETVSDYRFLVSGNYLVFYVVNDNTVVVRRVIHSKRDYCRLLFDVEPVDDLSEDMSDS
jgi:plasmid stabilization system protein ParE